MNSTVRLILVFFAAAIGGIMAADVPGILPEWAQVVIGALSAGLAGVGIVPPQYTSLGTRRYTSSDPQTPTHMNPRGEQIGTTKLRE